HAAIQKDREQMLDFRASSTAFAAALRKASDHALSVASAVAAAIVGALPAVLGPNHDNDRVEITTVGPSDPLALRAGSEQLPPRSCMAVRLGRAFDRR